MVLSSAPQTVCKRPIILRLDGRCIGGAEMIPATELDGDCPGVSEKRDDECYEFLMNLETQKMYGEQCEMFGITV